MKRIWTLLVVGFALATVSIPGTGWAQVYKMGAEVVEVRKLWSGSVQSLAIDGQRRIHVGGGLGSPVYQYSPDSGKTWFQSSYANNFFFTCWSLAQIDSGYVMAGTDGGIFITKDNGVTWNLALWPQPYGRGTTLFVAKNKNVFVGADIRIFRSTDNGNRWVSVADSAVVMNYVNTFTQTPDSTLVAGCSSGIPNSATGVLLSTDGGSSWKISSNKGLTDKNIMGVAAYTGGFSQTLFLATEFGGGFMSTDKGDSWRPLPINNIFGSVAFTCNPLGAFIGYGFPDNKGNSLYRQYGATAWEPIPGITDGVWAIVKWDAATLLVGTNSGLYLLSFYNPTRVENPTVPASFSLSQNYPNPFNPSTTIQFFLTERASVKLIITNVSGQEVARLLDGEEMGIGEHCIVWNGSRYASGVYWYRLQTSTGLMSVRKMVLVK